MEMAGASFDNSKKQRLQAVDLSRKGSIDTDIVDLVTYINNCSDYFTTSSCSGRMIVVQNDDADVPKKKGCKWQFTSHMKAEPDAVIDALANPLGDLVLKFEPFILHAQCRCLRAAQLMHSAAVAAGFRNSGITVGMKGKIMMAVRSSHGLEVPLSQDGQMLVTTKYITFLVNAANKKMEQNSLGIQRFYDELQKVLSQETTTSRCTRSHRKDNEDIRSISNKCSIVPKETVDLEDTFSSCLGLFDSDHG